MLRSTAITKELAVIERKLSETTNETLKTALKKKQARLKDELKDASKSAPQLAKTLLAQRAEIKALPKSDFNDLIRRLSKKPEYSFLKTMGKSTIRTDLERPAKPVGWRFKGRGNYDKPTMTQIAKGKRNGTVYREVRPIRSDVNLAVRLEDGGGVGNSLQVEFDIPETILNDNAEYFETKQSFIMFTKNLSAYVKKYVAMNLGEFINDSIENYKYERFLYPDENTSQKAIKDSTGNVKFDLSYSSIEGAFGEELDLSSMNQSELNDFKNYFSEDIKQKVIKNIEEFVEYSVENKIRDTKMSNGGVVGQEIVIDYQGDEYKGVIAQITDEGDYIVDIENGRTVLAQKDMDVISLGSMKKKSMPSERKKRFGLFEDGGNIEEENNEMLHSQAVEAKHHVEELHKVLTSKTVVEPWVVAKMERATTDLSDVTHYLDGENKADMKKPIYKNGGRLTDAQQAKFDKVMHEWKQGKLHSGSDNGPIVTDQDQAIAIAYAEARGMKKMAFGGMIDENNVSTGGILRMEGLSPNETLDEFINNAKYIVSSLEDEGFEKDEIYTFLAHMMIRNTGGNKMTTGGGVDGYKFEKNTNAVTNAFKEYLKEKDNTFKKTGKIIQYWEWEENYPEGRKANAEIKKQSQENQEKELKGFEEYVKQNRNKDLSKIKFDTRQKSPKKLSSDISDEDVISDFVYRQKYFENAYNYNILDWIVTDLYNYYLQNKSNYTDVQDFVVKIKKQGKLKEYYSEGGTMPTGGSMSEWKHKGNS